MYYFQILIENCKEIGVHNGCYEQRMLTCNKFKEFFFNVHGSVHRNNPFQSNFSANRILPISYLFWAVKRLVDYL
jgi:hypothetical protein